MERPSPRQSAALQHILMASLVCDGEDGLYDIRRPSVPTEPLLRLQTRPIVEDYTTSISGRGRGGLERMALARQTYRARGLKVLSQTCTIEFITPYIADRARHVMAASGMTPTLPSVVTSVAPMAGAANPSSKSPVNAFPASDILAAYNESRDRQMADNKVSTCVADTARGLENSARQQYETFSSNGQVPVGIHYRHRDKAEKGERLGQSYCENIMPGVENTAPPTVRLKNQFRPNGLRSSAPVSASQDGVASYSVPSKQQQQQQLQQPQQATPLMVSGISRQHVGRERDDDDYLSATSERHIADGGESGQLWQSVTAAGGASAQASPANGVNAGPASGSSPRRPLNKAASTPWRSPSHGGGSFSGSSGRASKKEVEPTYADPLAGAPASIQSRLAELAALESETVRWEKARKLKKKAKDRDD